MAKLSQKRELDLLRSYFIASETHYRVGNCDYLKEEPYNIKVGEMNQQFHNQRRIAKELGENTDLINFLKL